MCLRRQWTGVFACGPVWNLKTAKVSLTKTAKKLVLNISLILMAVIWVVITNTNSAAHSFSNNNQPDKLPPPVVSRMLAAIVINPGPVEIEESQSRHGETDAESFVMAPPPPPPDNGSSGDDILIRVER
ncbi:MAG: hypothetical protein IPM55_01790 [Acidobacteria bacterium]|nr:hypothetical protein [Acidobacteriota bacterium]